MEDVINSGKLGTVYKGYHVKTKENVAIKVIQKQQKGSQVRQEDINMLRNIVKQKCLEHNNLNQIYKVYQSRNNTYIIMEYAEGNIEQILYKHGRLSEFEVIKILKDIITGLVYLHKKKVYFEDVTPQNIVSLHGVYQFTDYLQYKMWKNFSIRITLTNAPQTYKLQSELSYGRSGHNYNTWSVGVILYQCLCGGTP